MNTSLGVIIVGYICLIAIIALFTTLIITIIKALRKYITTGEVRKEKISTQKCLGEVLKQHREECKMTQEFVAEAIGVSRQAVSKWENGTTDPSTSNLIAISKLFKISAEELIKEIL